MTKHKLLAELEEGLKHLKKSFGQREIVFNFTEAAKTLGLSRMSIYRYRRRYPDFPALPTFKTVVHIWAEQKGIPRKPGPLPSYRRKQVVYMHEELGQPFTKIARELGISFQAVRQIWKRHQQNGPDTE